VKHEVDPGDGTPTHAELAEITTEKFNLASHAREIRFVSRGAIVDHAHGVSKPYEPLGEMRTDKARSAGYQAP
jgi:hypothetical protein